MNLQEILSNEALRKREFPVAADKVFWSHASVAALPRRVVGAMREYVDACSHADQETVLKEHTVLETRQLAAQLLGCTPEEIALIGPTSVGLSLVANGLDWQRGDNVVFYADDYPSNVYPWLALEPRGVELRKIRSPKLGEVGLDDVAAQVDSRTRLVALTSAHFLTGHRLDVDGIGKYLREKGVLFCLDSIQSFGALQTKVGHVDFAAADAHKWLLGPLSMGIFYVRREIQDRLRPSLLGWNNVISPNFITQDTIRFPSHAGRYEAGTSNLVGIVGLHAALQILAEIGIGTIESRLLSFGESVIDGLERKGFQYLGPRDAARRSGILSFSRPGSDIVALHGQLLQRNIVVTLRMLRDGTRLLRLSPHFYNSEPELERLLAAL